MDAIIAVLTALAAVAGIAQTIVVLLERSERKRRETAGHPQLHYGASNPTSHPTPKRDQRAVQEFVDHPADTAYLPPQSGSTASGEAHEHQPFIESPNSFDHKSFKATTHSSLVYLVGFIGAFFYRNNASRKVRFHAAQSRWIDISAVIYFIFSTILIAIYIAIRYPGPNAEINPNDPVMWTWMLTSFLGPPILHITLAILTMTGRNIRLPLIWKIATAVADRQEERWHSPKRPLRDNFPQPPPLPPDLAKQSETSDHYDASTTVKYQTNHTPVQIIENDPNDAVRPTTQPPGQMSIKPNHPEKFVRPTPHESDWDPFRSDRGNEEGSYETFTSYKWLYWFLAPLIFILGITILIGALTSTSWLAKIVGTIATVFLVLLSIGFGGMAKSPIRLDIGSRGVQLFARNGSTWLPWEVIESIGIKSLGGTPHVVARLPYPQIFPDFDTFGGGPRFLPKLNAIAVCSIGVLRAPRHQVARALQKYGKGKFRQH